VLKVFVANGSLSSSEKNENRSRFGKVLANNTRDVFETVYFMYTVQYVYANKWRQWLNFAVGLHLQIMYFFNIIRGHIYYIDRFL